MSFVQIPSECMTCVKFQAFREYIVGKTAPVPIKVYDYYEPGMCCFSLDLANAKALAMWLVYNLSFLTLCSF